MHHSRDFDERERKARKDAAWFCLGECDPKDALTICAIYLAVMETNGPSLGDLFPPTWGDALLWADSATVPEVAAYTFAGMQRLGRSPLGIKTRKKLFAELWEGFSMEDRKAFLSRVDPDGKFIRAST